MALCVNLGRAGTLGQSSCLYPSGSGLPVRRRQPAGDPHSLLSSNVLLSPSPSGMQYLCTLSYFFLLDLGENARVSSAARLLNKDLVTQHSEAGAHCPRCQEFPRSVEKSEPTLWVGAKVQ